MNLAHQESWIRLGSYAGVLLLMASWEAFAPRRPLHAQKGRRWLSNLGLSLINTLAIRVLLPLGAVGVALLAEERGWGVLNNTALPAWASVILSIVAMDLAIYLQHILFHAVPVLWRLHLVHHADLDIDVTTGIRFHTIEVLLSMAIKAAVVVFLGVPALAALLFEVLLNATSLFNHGNVRMPRFVDVVLRFFLVTPDMHRIHHSTIPSETNSNFGFNLPWWDYLFGTYLAAPAKGQEAMTIGLEQIRDEIQADRLDNMLALPFVGPLGNYPVNRREPVNR